MAERLVEDPVLRHRLGFRRTTDEDGGGVLHVEIWVDPGGGTTPHLHPAMEERFTVLAGQPSFLAGRRWRTASPGDTVVVPPGVRHAYRNRGDEVAHFVCEARPPSSLQEFLEEVASLARSDALTRRALPKSPSAVLQAAVLAHRHRKMVVLLFPPMPPPILQRLLLPIFARLGERRSGRVGRFTQQAARTDGVTAVDGEPREALPFEGGRAIADPFDRTSELRALGDVARVRETRRWT